MLFSFQTSISRSHRRIPKLHATSSPQWMPESSSLPYWWMFFADVQAFLAQVEPWQPEQHFSHTIQYSTWTNLIGTGGYHHSISFTLTGFTRRTLSTPRPLPNIQAAKTLIRALLPLLWLTSATTFNNLQAPETPLVSFSCDTIAPRPNEIRRFLPALAIDIERASTFQDFDWKNHDHVPHMIHFFTSSSYYYKCSRKST